jgi:hypothetical protein
MKAANKAALRELSGKRMTIKPVFATIILVLFPARFLRSPASILFSGALPHMVLG